MPRTKTAIPDEFAGLRTRLAEWRSSHPERGRLPEAIWTAAIELARKHGVYRTASALPIDYGGLRKRVNQTATPPVSRSQFLEVLMPAAQQGNCVELMRVRFSGTVDWNHLFGAWRGE